MPKKNNIIIIVAILLIIGIIFVIFNNDNFKKQTINSNLNQSNNSNNLNNTNNIPSNQNINYAIPAIPEKLTTINGIASNINDDSFVITSDIRNNSSTPPFFDEKTILIKITNDTVFKTQGLSSELITSDFLVQDAEAIIKTKEIINTETDEATADIIFIKVNTNE